MSFLDTVARAKTYLRDHGRVSVAALKLEFDLDDARLEALIEELVDVQQVAACEGKVLSWIGEARPEASAPELETQATFKDPSESAEAAQAEFHFGGMNRGETQGVEAPPIPAAAVGTEVERELKVSRIDL